MVHFACGPLELKKVRMRPLVYRVEIDSEVRTYLRGLAGFTRLGRLNLCGFIDVLREYGDLARESCPRPFPNSTVFRFDWTFDAGPTIHKLQLAGLSGCG